VVVVVRWNDCVGVDNGVDGCGSAGKTFAQRRYFLSLFLACDPEGAAKKLISAFALTVIARWPMVRGCINGINCIIWEVPFKGAHRPGDQCIWTNRWARNSGASPTTRSIVGA
jgi:hypothetical protein